MKYRDIGLRIKIPEGKGPFPGRQFMELFDIETGDALNAAFQPASITGDPGGAISVTAMFFPVKIELA